MIKRYKYHRYCSQCLFDENSLGDYVKHADHLAKIKELEKPSPCGCCLGEPISGKKCVCRGTGTERGEIEGLRSLYIESEQKNKQLQDKLTEQRNEIVAMIKDDPDLAKCTFCRDIIATKIQDMGNDNL